MFIQTTNRVIEMSKGTMKPNFEYFCKVLISDKDRLIYSHQLFKSKALMKHNKKNPNNFFNENPKEHIKGSIPHSYNDDDSSNMVSNKKKVYNDWKYRGKTNHPKKICFKSRHELDKAKKKSPNEQSIALYFYSIQLSKYYSSMEWVIDSSSSNHMNGSFSLFTSCDSNRNTSQKVSISDDQYLLVRGYGNVKVHNGTLEYVFYVQGIIINFLSIYCI